MNRKILLLSLFVFCLLISYFTITRNNIIWAEQSGSTPDSGTDSHIKATYDLLAITYDQGSDDPGVWGDWGAYWNRIRSNLIDFSQLDVDYSQQSLVKYDDSGDADNETEESSWSNTAVNVWKDARTGLYWSNDLGEFTSQFNIANCSFFALSDRGDYDGLDADCGNALNACGALSLEAVTGLGVQTDWYVPTQKELYQAYIDGMYNQTGRDFTTWNSFKTSTELAGINTYVWGVELRKGIGGSANKVFSGHVRCVRRD